MTEDQSQALDELQQALTDFLTPIRSASEFHEGALDRAMTAIRSFGALWSDEVEVPKLAVVYFMAIWPTMLAGIEHSEGEKRVRIRRALFDIDSEIDRIMTVPRTSQ